jgi:cell wall-associated NlpC family hydrolase
MSAAMVDPIVAEAREWIDTRVVGCGAQKGVGCDCKGLVAGVARAVGRREGDSLAAHAGNYDIRKVDPRRLRTGIAALFDQARQARPGDILLLRIANRAQHMAFVSEAEAGVPTRMIHAIAHRPFRVREVPFDAYWAARLDSIWTWRGMGA